MDFEISETSKEIQRGLEKILARFGVEYWTRCDMEERFPQELWDELSDGGWLGLALPAEYGGGGLGMVEVCIAIETLARNGAGMLGSLFWGMTTIFGGQVVARHGTEAQKATLLPRLAVGEAFAFGLTEPDAGLNTLNTRTRARRVNGEWCLSGQKIWTSAIDRAGFYLVLARTSEPADEQARPGLTLFMVPTSAAGLSWQTISKMGTNTVKSFTVYIDDVRVGDDAILGELDKGFACLFDVLNPERMVMAAGCVGAGLCALDLAVRYANERVVWDRPIGAHQGLAFPLAQVRAELEAARLLTTKAAWLFDRGHPCATEAR